MKRAVFFTKMDKRIQNLKQTIKSKVNVKDKDMKLN